MNRTTIALLERELAKAVRASDLPGRPGEAAGKCVDAYKESLELLRREFDRRLERSRVLKRPYFHLEAVTEAPESAYTGMRVGLPPVCIRCRRAMDGPPSGCAEALCFGCYDIVHTGGALLYPSNPGSGRTRRPENALEQERAESKRLLS
jgi:hypothetical protein